MAKNGPKIGPTSQAESFASLDGRGLIARHCRAFERDAIATLGGEAAVSPMQRRFIRSLARQDARCEQLLRRAAASPGSISLELERRWNWHENAIRRGLKQLGLDARAAQAPTLDEYLAGKERAA